LAGATLKISRAATGPIRLIFLAHVLGIPLGAGQVAVFIATIMLLSASTAGVPSVSSGNRSLPAYVAAGIPAEYVVLLGVAVNLTDAILTLFNTTGYLSATAIVERFRRRTRNRTREAAFSAAAALPVGMERQ
jgi:Na+/H+-dicarboxylate symporter